MLLAAIAVPLEVALTEVALRSPPAEVTLTTADDEVLETNLIAPNVGAEVSTKTDHAGETVVLLALSVVLNVTVFSPLARTSGTVQTTLCCEAVDTDCHPPVPTLYPIVAMVVEADPAVAFAIP